MGAILLQNVGGQLGVKPIWSCGRRRSDILQHNYRFAILYLKVFWEQH